MYDKVMGQLSMHGATGFQHWDAWSDRVVRWDAWSDRFAKRRRMEQSGREIKTQGAIRLRDETHKRLGHKMEMD